MPSFQQNENHNEHENWWKCWADFRAVRLFMFFMFFSASSSNMTKKFAIFGDLQGRMTFQQLATSNIGHSLSSIIIFNLFNLLATVAS